MDVGGVGKIAVCCRIRPPETADSSSSTYARHSREGRSRPRGSTPIETDQRHVRLKPEYAALAEQNIFHGGGITMNSNATAAAAAAGHLPAGVRGGRRRGRWGFTFDDVMEEGCQQNEVYRRCAKSIVDSALVGLNGTVMAYGCTGAGKSYTMMGERGGDDNRRGICARALQDILREATRRRKNEVFSVQISFVEIYNEQLFDLSQPEVCPAQRRFSVYGRNESAVGKRSAASAHVPEEHTGGGGSRSSTRENTPQQPDLAIYERPDGSTYVKGLGLVPVSTEEEAMRMLRAGQTAREVAEHQFNHVSSRSHAVLTIHLTMRKKKGGGPGAENVEVGGRKGGVMTSKLNLVDLAGSEKSTAGASAGGVTALHREGCYINKSLTFLEQVTIALADKTREHVPFRQSKLTHLLKDSLGGNCRTLLVACVWPRPELLVQSLATLKFAARMRCIKTAPVVNERPWSMDDELSRLPGTIALDTEMLLRESARDDFRQAHAQTVAWRRLRRQVHQLKAEVALNDDLGFAVISPTQRRRIWEEAGRFVLEGSKRASMRTVAVDIRTREMSAGEGGEQGETDGEDEGGGSDASEVLQRGCTMTPETNITCGPRGEPGAQENFTSNDGCLGERTDKLKESGAVGGERRRQIRRHSVSATPSASVPVLVSSPPQRHERLPSVGTARHAHELCLALREFVWEAAVATTTESLRESSSSSKKSNNHDSVCNTGEHEKNSSDVQLGNGNDNKGVCSAAAAVRSAVHTAVEGSKSWVLQEGSRQGGERRRLKKRGRRHRRPLAAHSAEETEGWVPRAERPWRGGQETDGVRLGAIGSSHLPQSGEQHVRSAPGVAEESVATTALGERRTVRSAGVREEEGFGISHGSPANSNAEGLPIPTKDIGRVGGGESDDLGGAFERFKQGSGRVIDGRRQDAKAAIKQGRSLVKVISGRINAAKARIDHVQTQLQQLEGEGEVGLQLPPNCCNQSYAKNSSRGLRSTSPPDPTLSEGTGQTEDAERRPAGEEEHNRQFQKQKSLLTAQLRGLKKDYRGLFEELDKAKAALRGYRQHKQQALQTLLTEFQKEQQKSATGTAVFLPPLSGTEEHQSTTTDGSGDGGGQGCHASAATTPTAVAAASVVQRAASS